MKQVPALAPLRQAGARSPQAGEQASRSAQAAGGLSQSRADLMRGFLLRIFWQA